MSNIWVGIDPGTSGAVAVIDAKNNVVTLQDTPTITVKKGKHNHTVYVATQMVTILENIRDSGHVCVVAIENVHAMPKQGVTSMFSMGNGFGLWLGILAALRLPIRKIEPVQWKRAMRIPTGSAKGESIVRALQIFPRADLPLKKHHGRADALLIAEFVRGLEP